MFLTLGSVCAADVNTTDVGVVQENVEVTSDEDVLQSDEQTQILESDNSSEGLCVSDMDLLGDLEIEIGDEYGVMLDEQPEITITFGDDIDASRYFFYIDGKVYSEGMVIDPGEFVSIDIDKLSCGNHTYKLVYTNNKDKKVTKTGTFFADWGAYWDDANLVLDNMYDEYQESFDDVLGIDFNVTTNYLRYGDVYRNAVSLPSDANGNIEVIVNNRTSYYFGPRDYRNIVIPDLPIGLNTLLFKYKDERYSIVKSVSDQIIVYAVVEGPNSISCMENATFSLTLPDDAVGKLMAYVDGDEFYCDFVKGRASLTLPLLNAGIHRIWVGYTQKDYTVKPFGSYYIDYDDEANEITIYDNVSVGPNVTFPKEMDYASDENLVFKLPANARGNLKVKIDGKDVSVNFKDGISKISLSKLLFGSHRIDLNYGGDGMYPIFKGSYDVFINYRAGDIRVDVPKVIFTKSSAKLTFIAPKGCSGKVIVFSYGKTYSGKFSDGKAVVSIKTQNSAMQAVYYRFDFSSNFSWHGLNINLEKKPLIKYLTPHYDENYFFCYGIDDVFKFKLVKANGKSIGAGKKVTISFYDVNDKKVLTKTLKTDKNGIGKVNIKSLYSKPYDYFSVKIGYEGATYYTRLWYKSPLNIDNDHLIGTYHYPYSHLDYILKKSSKKVSMRFKLNNGFTNKYKKFLKNTKFNIKFNGKTYKLKTNSKGYATFTFSKAVLKKLKVGKVYTLKTIYGRDKFNYKIKVKK